MVGRMVDDPAELLGRRVGVDCGDIGFTLMVGRIVDRVGRRVGGWYCWG